MYSLAIYLYMFAANVAALFGNKKARLMVRGHHHTWRILRDRIKPADRPIWFHAASLGEFEQGRVLMERLKREQPGCKILLTFFSPSGYEVRKDYEYADAVCYLPFDTFLGARKFLRLAHPEKAIFIKYEFWANYMERLRRQGVPLYSVSSIFRPGQVFFRWYGGDYRRVLRCVTHFYVQNEESRCLLASRGINNVSVTGDTRLDRVVQIKEAARPLPLVAAFAEGADKVFVAGSSWPPDEDVYLPYFASTPGWKLIIATHEVSTERTERLRQRFESLGLHTVAYSELKAEGGASLAGNDEAGERPSVLIIDCFGLLSSIYRYATVAYVGGGFGAGIHNVPEAAVYGLPVLFGPNNQKFQEAQALLKCGGAFQVESPEEFTAVVRRFTDEPASLAAAGRASETYISSSSGASERIYAAIFGA